MKLLNNRLNNYLSKSKILQPNNQAGVQGSSTMEIITNIATIIESCNQPLLKKNFYILIQDLLKAYDRVNLDLLMLALQRLSIPSTFINITISLFKNHSNQIIFEDFLSEPYDLDIGIIQGEIISLLLWIIYYDSMFQAINETNYGGLTLSISLSKNIYQQTDYHSIELNLKLQGYLDNTTWIDNNLDNLQKYLTIAVGFYNIANIKINKQKTKLLTNDPQL
jgi:hypothetical protein